MNLAGLSHEGVIFAALQSALEPLTYKSTEEAVASMSESLVRFYASLDPLWDHGPVSATGDLHGDVLNVSASWRRTIKDDFIEVSIVRANLN